MRLLPLLLLSVGFLQAADFPVGSKLDSISTTRTLSGPGKVTFRFGPGEFRSKLLAVVFVSAKSPISQAYTARVNKLFHDYNEKGPMDGVTVMYVVSNADESEADLKYFLGKLDLEVTRDVDGALADRLNVHSTPEALLFDNSGRLLYRGRIDDSVAPENVKSEDLRNAIEAALADKTIPVPETKAPGDPINRSTLSRPSSQR